VLAAQGGAERVSTAAPKSFLFHTCIIRVRGGHSSQCPPSRSRAHLTCFSSKTAPASQTLQLSHESKSRLNHLAIRTPPAARPPPNGVRETLPRAVIFIQNRSQNRCHGPMIESFSSHGSGGSTVDIAPTVTVGARASLPGLYPLSLCHGLPLRDRDRWPSLPLFVSLCLPPSLCLLLSLSVSHQTSACRHADRLAD